LYSALAQVAAARNDSALKVESPKQDVAAELRKASREPPVAQEPALVVVGGGIGGSAAAAVDSQEERMRKALDAKLLKALNKSGVGPVDLFAGVLAC
jgi:hypothetical protein